MKEEIWATKKNCDAEQGHKSIRKEKRWCADVAKIYGKIEFSICETIKRKKCARFAVKIQASSYDHSEWKVLS